jgi:hypothetical protein
LDHLSRDLDPDTAGFPQSQNSELGIRFVRSAAVLAISPPAIVLLGLDQPLDIAFDQCSVPTRFGRTHRHGLQTRFVNLHGPFAPNVIQSASDFRIARLATCAEQGQDDQARQTRVLVLMALPSTYRSILGLAILRTTKVLKQFVDRLLHIRRGHGVLS